MKQKKNRKLIQKRRKQDRQEDRYVQLEIFSVLEPPVYCPHCGRQPSWAGLCTRCHGPLEVVHEPVFKPERNFGRPDRLFPNETALLILPDHKGGI